MLRKAKTNEAQRRKQAESIRQRGIEQMAEHDPSATESQAISGCGADPGAVRADAKRNSRILA